MSYYHPDCYLCTGGRGTWMCPRHHRESLERSERVLAESAERDRLRAEEEAESPSNVVLSTWRSMSGAFFDAAERARETTAGDPGRAAPAVIDEDTTDVARPAWLPPVKGQS